MSTPPRYEELTVRRDPETGLGVVYVPPGLIEWRVLLVPLHPREETEDET